MKTFTTSGTGGGQTLSEIETDKIPVYNSKEDVEADLANLSAGQIVATADTGDELSHPVDVVEEGNLHAVSSNAVASAFKGMTIAECGKIAGREQYDDSWYIKYDCGIIEEWWVASSLIPAMSGSPIASCDFTVTFPIPLKEGTKALQFDIYNQSVYGSSATLWFGTSNGANDSNTKQSVSAFAGYAYPNQTGNVRMHVVGFWK